MKRIVLLGTLVAVTVVVLAASSLSVNAQVTGQVVDVCAPWSKAWDLSQGRWYFEWYRWCYDPVLSNPSLESNWYMERGTWEWGETANLCPESGTCTVSPGNVQMTSMP